MPCVGVWSCGSHCGNAGLDNLDGHRIFSLTECIPNEVCFPSLRELTLQFMFVYAVCVISNLCSCTMM